MCYRLDNLFVMALSINGWTVDATLRNSDGFFKNEGGSRIRRCSHRWSS